MIPCRLNSLLNVAKRATPSYTFVLPRRYTTENKDAPQFWELKVQEKTDDSTETPSKARQDIRNFKSLLDKLFTAPKQTSEVPPLEPLNQSPSSAIERTETIIHKKLLDMVLNKSKPIKSRAPLPYTLAPLVFGRKQDDHDGRWLDTLDRESATDFPLSEDERIQVKQHEVKTIQSILEATTPSELLALVEKEVNQESDKYPAYYPRVLAAAIDHISTKDPYVALTIFEMAKTKSISSYLTGCTIDVYNAMLRMHWDLWRDVHGMLSLVEEMTVNGIACDRRSRQIVKQAVQEIESEGDHSFESGVFWNADEKRSCHVMKELVGKWLV